MKAYILPASQKEAWDQFVHSSPQAISWHVYDWSRVLQDFYRLEYFPLAACDGPQVCGVLPLYRVRTLRGGSALISIPYVVAGGIVAADREAEQRLLQAARELSDKHGSLPLVLKQYGQRVEGDFVTDDGYYNRELSLDIGIDQLWEQLEDENKKSLGTSEKDGFTLEYPSDDGDAFFSMLSKYQHRCGVPCPSRNWVRHLQNSGLYDLALLKQDSAITAGTLVKRFRTSVSFPLTCDSGGPNGDLRQAYRLYWELIRRLAGEGVDLFHSGRIPHNDAVPKYRLGWGGRKCNYYYQYSGYRGKTESSGKRSPRRRLFQTAWRSLPRRVCQLLGPTIIKQFP